MLLVDGRLEREGEVLFGEFGADEVGDALEGEDEQPEELEAAHVFLVRLWAFNCGRWWLWKGWLRGYLVGGLRLDRVARKVEPHHHHRHHPHQHQRHRQRTWVGVTANNLRKQQLNIYVHKMMPKSPECHFNVPQYRTKPCRLAE